MSRTAGLVAIASWLASAAAARAAFERAPLDAGSAALGGVIAMSEDVVFGNPARGASEVERGRAPAALRADISRPFGFAELSEGQVSVCVPARHGAIGVGARRFGSAAYSEREARLVLAAARGPAALGAAVRGLVVSGPGITPVRSAAVDAALFVRTGEEAEVGGFLEAAAGETPGDPRGEGRRAGIGAARRIGPYRFVVEAHRRGQGPLAGVVGFSWQPWPALALLGGASSEPPGLSWGCAVRRGALAVQAAATHHEALGITVRVGLRLGNTAGPGPTAFVSCSRLRPSGMPQTLSFQGR